MKKFLIATVLSLFTISALGATVTSDLSWQAPTTRVNQEVLTIDEIEKFVIETQVNGSVVGTDEVDNLETEFVKTVEVPVSTDVTTISYRMKTVDVFGLESVWSEPVMVSGVIAPSSAPSTVNSIVHIQNCTNCTLIIEDTSTQN